MFLKPLPPFSLGIPSHLPLLTVSLFFVSLLIIFIYIFKKLFYCSITVVCILSPPLPLTQGKPTSLLASTLPLGFVHVSFIVVPENPSPYCPFPPPLWLLVDCS